MRQTAIAGCLLILAAPQAAAADWSFNPRVEVAGVYNDNNRLTDIPGSEIEVLGGRLDAQVALQARTPVSSFLLTPRVRSSFFPGEPSEEADDQFIRMSINRLTQRAGAALGVNYSRVVTLGDYFPGAAVSDNDELGNPDRGVGVGRFGTRNREERLSFSPSAQYALSQRWSLEVGAEYLDVSYDRQVQDDREDYRDIYGSVGVRRTISLTKSLLLRGTYSSYDPATGDRTAAQGLSAEWRNRLSPTAETYIRGAAGQVEILSADGDSSWENVFGGGAGVRWRFEVMDVWLDASRSLDPSSTGRVVVRDEVRVQLVRRVTPMAQLIVGGRYIRDSSAASAQNFSDRSYAIGNIGFDQRLGRKWTLFGRYAYAQVRYDNPDSDVRSNEVSLGIIYEPNRL